MIVNIKNRNKTIYERTETLMRYYDDIKKYKVLSQDEEIDLFRIIRSGKKIESQKAKETLINCNQRFIVSVAKNYGTNSNLLDLINEGNIGLIEAIDSYDTSKNIRFLSYAIWYIRRAINQYCINTSIVRKNNISKTYHAISSATNKFLQKEERLPTSAELLTILQNEYNINIKEVNDINETHIINIDDDYQSDDDSYNPSIAEFNLYSASKNDVENTIDNEFNKKLLSNLLNILSPRDKQIIEMSFGIGYERPYEIQEIAKEIGLTNERVRQIKLVSLEKLKNKVKENSYNLR